MEQANEVKDGVFSFPGSSVTHVDTLLLENTGTIFAQYGAFKQFLASDSLLYLDLLWS